MTSTSLEPWSATLRDVRYAATGQGHYESFYVKANHPERRQGLWLKFNLLEPVGHPEQLQGELWGVWFDGERGQHVVAGQELPGELIDARHGGQQLRIGEAQLELRDDLLTERARVIDRDHTLAWDIELRADAAPAVLYPARWMYEGGFPKKKVVTPIPHGRLHGWIEVDGERHLLEGWDGFHGHNWGREHAHRYAYGNGLFPDGAYVDGFTARLKLGRLVSPFLSLLMVRLPDGRELAFNRPARWLGGHPLVEDLHWEIDLPGQDGTRAWLALCAEVEDAVGLRYRYPDGRIGFCVNTKFGLGTLRVEQRGQVLYEGTCDRCELETFGPIASPGALFETNDVG